MLLVCIIPRFFVGVGLMFGRTRMAHSEEDEVSDRLGAPKRLQAVRDSM